MARQADYDVDLFAEMVRGGSFSGETDRFKLIDAKTENNPVGAPLKNRKSN